MTKYDLQIRNNELALVTELIKDGVPPDRLQKYLEILRNEKSEPPTKVTR